MNFQQPNIEITTASSDEVHAKPLNNNRNHPINKNHGCHGYWQVYASDREESNIIKSSSMLGRDTIM